MELSSSLIREFAKSVAPEKAKSESFVYGTVHKTGDSLYVQMDGSENLTPVESNVDVSDNDRVMVLIKDHSAVITSNATSPSVGNTQFTEYKEDAAADISEAKTTAQNALTSANGKNKVYYLSSEPTGGTYVEGDIWFKTNSNGIVESMWRYGTDSWVEQKLNSGVFSSIDAGVVSTGILSAILIKKDDDNYWNLATGAFKTSNGTFKGTIEGSEFKTSKFLNWNLEYTPIGVATTLPYHPSEGELLRTHLEIGDNGFEAYRSYSGQNYISRLLPVLNYDSSGVSTSVLPSRAMGWYATDFIISPQIINVNGPCISEAEARVAYGTVTNFPTNISGVSAHICGPMCQLTFDSYTIPAKGGSYHTLPEKLFPIRAVDFKDTLNGIRVLIRPKGHERAGQIERSTDGSTSMAFRGTVTYMLADPYNTYPITDPELF